MAPKVKGFLKGLKYIQNIFENPKEPELEIGLPTDVKHVAHIGGDGPPSNAPSWMNEFDSTQLTLPPVPPAGEDGEPGDAPTKHPLSKNKKEAETSPRSPLTTGHGPPLGSPPKKSSRKHHLRRNRAPANAPSDSGAQESPKATSKHGRRHKKSVDLSSTEPSSESKPSRRKRSSKGSSGGGSSTTSKSKTQESFDEVLTIDPELSSVSGHGPKNNKIELSQTEEGGKEGSKWSKLQEKTRLLLKSETKATIAR